MGNSNAHPPKAKFDIKLFGDTLVGKTCLVRRFESGAFQENGPIKVGASTHEKRLKVQNQETKLFICDVFGQETFRREILPIIVRHAEGVLLLYDVASLFSFHQLPMFLEILNKSCPGAIIFIIGARSDLVDRREVSRETGQQFASDKNLEFLECSSKTGENVNQVFELMVIRLLLKKSLIPPVSKEFIEKEYLGRREEKLIPPGPKELVEGKYFEKKREKLNASRTNEESVSYGCASENETCKNSLKSFQNNVSENSEQGLETLEITSLSDEDLYPGHKDSNPVHKHSNPGHKDSNSGHEQTNYEHKSCHMLTISDPHESSQLEASKSSEQNEISHTLEDKKEVPLKKEKPVLSEEEMFLQGKCPAWDA